MRAELRLWGRPPGAASSGWSDGNDLTHAASIAYYALLSLFPFLLLVISMLGSSRPTRPTACGAQLRVPLFPDAARFRDQSARRLSRRALQLGVAGRSALIWARSASSAR